MNLLRRIIRPKGLLIFLCLAVILLAAGAQKVSATEQKAYLIKVNRACNTITIYGKDKNGEYNVPVKAMACSVGVSGRTITGTFQTKEKYRWKALMGDVWGQYATRIVGGILFHSVYYYENGDPASLATKQYNKLGTAASHGCIRLTVGDAKWIYDNCASGTTVIIYDDKGNPGPLGKPETIKLPTTVRWDPTDPSLDNPYHKNFPKFTGVGNFKMQWGKKVDLLNGVTAQSSLGEDITALIQVEGSIDSYTPGEYTVTYSVTDSLSRTETKTIIITVEECLADPEIIGVKDHLVTGDVIIDDAFARNGVEVYRGGLKLEDNLLKVTIEQLDEVDYKITYQVTIDDITVAANANVHIDKEAPVISGVKDFTLEAGEVPSIGYVLDGITASDNYSETDKIKLTAAVEENPDGTFLINYTAKDEAGNIATAKASVLN
jgi:hypothetical protein